MNVPQFYTAFDVKPGDGMFLAPKNAYRSGRTLNIRDRTKKHKKHKSYRSSCAFCASCVPFPRSRNRLAPCSRDQHVWRYDNHAVFQYRRACNVCEPPDPYASIARMKSGRQPDDCNKSSPPLRLSDIVYFRMDASARPELTRGTLSNKTMSSRYVMYSRT